MQSESGAGGGGMPPPAAGGSVTTRAGAAGGAEVAAGESGAPAGARGASLRSMGGRARSVYIVYAIVALFYLFGRFVDGSYGSNAFYISAVTLGVFVLVSGFGQTVVMLSGGFDLSIPGMITLAGILLMGFAGAKGSGAGWAIPAVLCIGLIVGLVNGIGVVGLGLSPIVMTLAVNTILSGAVLVYTQGTPKGATPSAIIRLVQGNVGGVPSAVIVFAVVGVVGVVVLNFTSFGRRLYAVGSSPRAATLAGISVPRITVAAYMLSGLAAAVGGILLSGYANRAFLDMGDPYLMLSLAAAVVGGISVRGGRGYFAGTAGAALILMIVTGVLASTALPEAVRDIVLGIIIIGVVVLARHETATLPSWRGSSHIPAVQGRCRGLVNRRRTERTQADAEKRGISWIPEHRADAAGWAGISDCAAQVAGYGRSDSSLVRCHWRPPGAHPDPPADRRAAAVRASTSRSRSA